MHLYIFTEHVMYIMTFDFVKTNKNPLKASQKLVVSHSNQWRKLHSEAHTPQSGQSGSRICCFQRGTSGKESSCQCRRHKSHGFDP